MSYRSEVFAAIAGSKAALEQLIQLFKPFSNVDEQEIFSCFKLVEMKENCWIFAFYDPNVKWYKEPEDVWHVIRDCAKFFEFSYVFYRIGDDLEDIEMDEYCTENGKEFYHILIDSVSLNRNIDLDDRVKSVFENQQ